MQIASLIDKFSSPLILFAIVLHSAGCGQKQTKGVVIKNRGSDTLVQVAQAWSEEHKVVNTDVTVQVSGGGSGTGITALINVCVDRNPIISHNVLADGCVGAVLVSYLFPFLVFHRAACVGNVYCPVD